MNIVLLSEFWDPSVGGGTEMTKRVAEVVASQGHRVWLVIPAFDDEHGYDAVNRAAPYELVPIVVKCEAEGFVGPRRQVFALKANKWILDNVDSCRVDVVHVLAGMYLVSNLSVGLLKQKGVRAFAGILNVPPNECRTSWPGDKATNRIVDELRAQVLKVVYRRRLRGNEFDCYFANSEGTATTVGQIVGHGRIINTNQGYKARSYDVSGRVNGGRRLLTVGGFVPHKRQHIIPQVARKLVDAGFSGLDWKVVGPVRNERYYNYCLDSVRRSGVSQEVQLMTVLPESDLVKLYGDSNIYVQPSSEEGFCLTALDAVLAGLPIVVTPTGALQQLAGLSSGICCDGQLDTITSAILKIDKLRIRPREDEIANVRQDFSWQNVVDTMIAQYRV